MNNKYFKDEIITFNDLYFVCYMIERVARKLKQPNSYIDNYNSSAYYEPSYIVTKAYLEGEFC